MTSIFYRGSGFALTGLAFALLCALPARAVPVAPGGAPVALPGITVAAEPSLAGTVLADVQSHWVSAIDPLYGFPGAEGELISRVVRQTGSGTLDFYWRITVETPSYPNFVPRALEITGLALGNFLTGANFDADYRPDGLGTTAPSGAFSTDAGSFTYTFSALNFGPGSQSYFLLLHSNATSYDASAFATLGVTTVETFAPTAPIPEPQTWLLMAGGLAALGLARVRRARGSADASAATRRRP